MIWDESFIIKIYSFCFNRFRNCWSLRLCFNKKCLKFCCFLKSVITNLFYFNIHFIETLKKNYQFYVNLSSIIIFSFIMVFGYFKNSNLLNWAWGNYLYRQSNYSLACSIHYFYLLNNNNLRWRCWRLPMGPVFRDCNFIPLNIDFIFIFGIQNLLTFQINDLKFMSSKMFQILLSFYFKFLGHYSKGFILYGRFEMPL